MSHGVHARLVKALGSLSVQNTDKGKEHYYGAGTHAHVIICIGLTRILEIVVTFQSGCPTGFRLNDPIALLCVTDCNDLTSLSLSTDQYTTESYILHKKKRTTLTNSFKTFRFACPFNVKLEFLCHSVFCTIHVQSIS